MNQHKRFSSKIYSFAAGAGLLLASCTNSKLDTTALKAKTTGTTAKTQTGANLVSSKQSYSIVKSEVNAVASGTNSIAYEVTLTFDSPTKVNVNDVTPPDKLITMACNPDSVVLPCQCLFKWDDRNNRTGLGAVNSEVYFRREFKTKVKRAGDNFVVCPTAPQFATDITVETPVEISLIPGDGNQKNFETLSVDKKPYQHKMVSLPDFGNGAGATNQDAVLEDVFRYTCFQKYKKATEVRNVNLASGNSNFDSPLLSKVVMASRFCTGTNSSDGGSDSNCPEITNQVSNQSAYFNLYVRKSQRNIPSANSNFACPLVTNFNDSSGSGSVYPLDSSFSLSNKKTVDFKVPVEANSFVSTLNDPVTATPESCTPDPASSSNSVTITNSNLVRKCLGWALAPAKDGSCPAAGPNKVPTYRLRRFVMMYPPQYEPSGKLRGGEAPQVDTIYVLDRQVKEANGTTYDVVGPKPCPMAYFDSKSVTLAEAAEQAGRIEGAMEPGFPPNPTDRSGLDKEYIGTNNPVWDGKNVDGIEFPSFDSSPITGVNSCAAVLPRYKYDGRTWRWSLGTVHWSSADPKMRRVFVRPIQSWAPNYVEDLSFQACAPAPSVPVDPPLHVFAESRSWCAEVYPTLNRNVDLLENKGVDGSLPGKARNYTSHYHPSCSLPQGYDSYLPSNYPATGYARAQKRQEQIAQNTPNKRYGACDRQVVSKPDETGGKFPLLAPQSDVEKALMLEPTYACQVTTRRRAATNGTVTGEPRFQTLPPVSCCKGVDTGFSHVEPGPGKVPACNY